MYVYLHSKTTKNQVSVSDKFHSQENTAIE